MTGRSDGEEQVPYAALERWNKYGIRDLFLVRDDFLLCDSRSEVTISTALVINSIVRAELSTEI